MRNFRKFQDIDLKSSEAANILRIEKMPGLIKKINFLKHKETINSKYIIATVDYRDCRLTIAFSSGLKVVMRSKIIAYNRSFNGAAMW